MATEPYDDYPFLSVKDRDGVPSLIDASPPHEGSAGCIVQDRDGRSVLVHTGLPWSGSPAMGSPDLYSRIPAGVFSFKTTRVPNMFVGGDLGRIAAGDDWRCNQLTDGFNRGAGLHLLRDGTHPWEEPDGTPLDITDLAAFDNEAVPQTNQRYVQWDTVDVGGWGCLSYPIVMQFITGWLFAPPVGLAAYYWGLALATRNLSGNDLQTWSAYILGQGGGGAEQFAIVISTKGGSAPTAGATDWSISAWQNVVPANMEGAIFRVVMPRPRRVEATYLGFTFSYTLVA